jgi:hypothetical protein
LAGAKALDILKVFGGPAEAVPLLQNNIGCCFEDKNGTLLQNKVGRCFENNFGC